MSKNRRVVITGIGVVSPIGNDVDTFWNSLKSSTSGVDFLQSLPRDGLNTQIGGEATDFLGKIDDFGELAKDQKKTIRKGLKLMCRDIEMGVAVAQKALQHAGIEFGKHDADRSGVIYGCDYILTRPEEFSNSVAKCKDDQGAFQYSNWGEKGLDEVTPLWLLKYLPNMPASHVAIYNDFRGPNNSITLREASSNLAFGEAYCTIERNHADVIIAGGTGTRIHPVRSVHLALQEQLATSENNPASASRPFDLNRSGMVLGEGAGALIFEELESAKARGATIYAEVTGYGSSSAISKTCQPDFETAVFNAIQGALRTGEASPDDVGHVNAHGLSMIQADVGEAKAIARVFNQGDRKIPVVAPKSYFGNLGAGSGAVELAASVLSLKNDSLFESLNYETPDPECPININTQSAASPGDSFVSVNFSPFGQASAILVKKYAA